MFFRILFQEYNTDKIIPFDEDQIALKIYIIRDINVMLDCDPALLYGIETKALKQAAKRNTKRFPPDFMFELIKDKFTSLTRTGTRLKELMDLNPDTTSSSGLYLRLSENQSRTMKTTKREKSDLNSYEFFMTSALKVYPLNNACL